MDHEPVTWQERHSPTEAVEVREYQQDPNSGAVKPVLIGRTRRRKLDARVFEEMSPDQERAAALIVRGFELVVGGLGYVAFRPERTDPSHDVEERDRDEAIVRDYYAWRDAMIQERLSVEAAEDWLVSCKSLRQIDRARHKRKGWARDNLFAALNAHCNLTRRRRKAPVRREAVRG